MPQELKQPFCNLLKSTLPEKPGPNFFQRCIKPPGDIKSNEYAGIYGKKLAYWTFFYCSSDFIKYLLSLTLKERSFILFYFKPLYEKSTKKHFRAVCMLSQ